MIKPGPLSRLRRGYRLAATFERCPHCGGGARRIFLLPLVVWPASHYPDQNRASAEIDLATRDNKFYSSFITNRKSGKTSAGNRRTV